jgi:hypothetical protein
VCQSYILGIKGPRIQITRVERRREEKRSVAASHQSVKSIKTKKRRNNLNTHTQIEYSRTHTTHAPDSSWLLSSSQIALGAVAPLSGSASQSRTGWAYRSTNSP